jgi:hypothetical protein
MTKLRLLKTLTSEDDHLRSLLRSANWRRGIVPHAKHTDGNREFQVGSYTDFNWLVLALIALTVIDWVALKLV